MDQNEQDMIYIDGSDFNLSSMSDFLLKISMSRTVWCNIKKLSRFENVSKCSKMFKVIENAKQWFESFKIPQNSLHWFKQSPKI